MTTDDLVERVARVIHAKEYDPEHYPFEREDAVTQRLLKDQARAAIAVVLEEAAKVAENSTEPNPFPTRQGAIAAAIRALVKT